jgi:Flp pilus assembly pilin Flp
MNRYMALVRDRSRSLMGDSRGATMVEYIVIVSLVFLVAFSAWKALGTNINTKVQQAAQALQ